MKKLFVILLAVLLSTSFAYAAGGKNHGEKGQGTVSTGEKAKGSASQKRAGR